MTRNIQKRLISGAFWASLATVASKGFALVAGIVVARMLGAELYGEIGVVQNSIAMFQILASFSVGLACSKYVAELKEVAPEDAGGVVGFSLIFSILSGTIIGILFFLLSPFLAANILGRPEIVGPLKISSLLLVLGAWNGVQVGTLSGFEAFRSQAISNFFSGMVTFFCMIVGAYIWKTQGVIFGMIVGLFSQCCINSYMVRGYFIKYKIKIYLQRIKSQFCLLYEFSLPAMLGGLIHWISIWLGNVMLVNRVDGYVQMGVYNASYQWFSIVLFFPSILTNTILPIMAERRGVKDLASTKKVLLSSVKYSFMAALPVGIILTLFSKYIMKFYGHGFDAEWAVFVVIIIAALFACAQNMIGNTFVVVGKMWIHFKLNMLWCFLYLVNVCFLLGQGFGAMALALAGCIAYIIRFLFVMIFSFAVLRTVK